MTLHCNRAYQFYFWLFLAILLGFPLPGQATGKASNIAKEPIIVYQFAVYYPDQPSPALLEDTRRLITKDFPAFRLEDNFDKRPAGPVLSLHQINDAGTSYAPPDLNYLQYFGRGLTPDNARKLQSTKTALVVNIAYPVHDKISGLSNALRLMLVLAERENGLIWDESTREIFTPKAWRDMRVSTWTGNAPSVVNQTVIHAYRNGEFVRAISLGMSKFGLPDIVINNTPASTSGSIAELINLLSQSLFEGAALSQQGTLLLDIKRIRNKQLHDDLLAGLKKNGKGKAIINLRKAAREEGDPDNDLIEITFDHYPGQSVTERQGALLSTLFGSEDHIVYIKHNAEIIAASERARAKLDRLREDFRKGFPTGEFLQLKAPFPTPKGGNEYMWVEVTEWDQDKIRGVLRNVPFQIPDLKSGAMVQIRQQDVFDYIHFYPGGREEGNESGKLIEKYQSR